MLSSIQFNLLWNLSYPYLVCLIRRLRCQRRRKVLRLLSRFNRTVDNIAVVREFTRLSLAIRNNTEIDYLDFLNSASDDFYSSWWSTLNFGHDGSSGSRIELWTGSQQTIHSIFFVLKVAGIFYHMKGLVLVIFLHRGHIELCSGCHFIHKCILLRFFKLELSSNFNMCLVLHGVNASFLLVAVPVDHVIEVWNLRRLGAAYLVHFLFFDDVWCWNYIAATDVKVSGVISPVSLVIIDLSLRQIVGLL